MINKVLITQNHSKTFNSSRIDLLTNFIKLIISSSIKTNDEKESLSKINLLTEEERESLFRKIFDLSRKTGLGILKEYESLNIKETIEIINSLKIPCIEDSFEVNEETKSAKSTRKTCICSANEVSCQYWRESLDGLIMGLGDNERYVRHQSILYGKNNTCIDVIYDSSVSDMRWGEMPSEISMTLTPIIEKYQKKGVEIILKGLNEKTLYFQIKDKNSNIAGFRRKYILENFGETFNKKFPDLNIFEISPRAVIEEGF